METLLKVEGVSKRFPGVLALNRVNFDVQPGEVHVLLGENGAGKSTLMNILSGLYRMDEGHMVLKGSSYEPKSPRDAMSHGVGIIHQELQLVPYLSAADNIFLGEELGSPVRLNKAAMKREATGILRSLGMEIPVTRAVSTLGIAGQQMVEIAKTLRRKVDLLILDEPTATLSDREVERFFQAVRSMKEAGVGIVYISHRLEEIPQIGDRVTILRDGSTIGTMDVATSDHNDWVRMMVGRDLDQVYPKANASQGQEVLRVEKLCSQGHFKDVSFTLYEGEVLALAGLVGSGRTEILRAIFGADSFDSGDIWVYGKKVKIRHPADAVRLGLGFLTEDRKSQGLILDASVQDNVTLPILKQLLRRFVVDQTKARTIALSYCQRLSIKTPSITQAVGLLSGGNQQKVVLSKWLAVGSRILMIDEPTRGIDVGAKSEIYQLIAGLVEAGWAVLMVSSEMPEVLGVADRILVLNEGTLQAELSRAEATQEKIAQYAMGGLRCG